LVVLEEDDAYLGVLDRLVEKGVDVALICKEAKNATEFEEQGVSRETYEALAIVAESGAFLKLPNTDRQAASGEYRALTSVELPMEFIEGILSNYAHQTDGSYVHKLSKTIVWNYDTADPDFGAWQAKELVDHLEGVLSSLDVINNKQEKEVLVKPKGVSKGRAVGLVLERKKYDFVLCVGNDRSDEDAFEVVVDKSEQNGGVSYCVVVGQKPSKAAWYVNDVREVVGVLERMVDERDEGGEGKRSIGGAVTFADDV
jgi:trehalose 6-phosphate synthase/phosphatase